MAEKVVRKVGSRKEEDYIMRRFTAYVMVMVFVFNAIICNAGSAQAFELREGDVFEDDEDYDMTWSLKNRMRMRNM